MTKPVCKKDGSGSESGSDKDEVDVKCDSEKGKCAPWCKQDSYDCFGAGECEDFSSCVKGVFTKKACSCSGEAGQVISQQGCCIAASVGFTCKSLLSGASTYDATVDITQCDIDPVASAKIGFPIAKGLSRIEECGFVIDPRCTHGKSVDIFSFELTFN